MSFKDLTSRVAVALGLKTAKPSAEPTQPTEPTEPAEPKASEVAAEPPVSEPAKT